MTRILDFIDAALDWISSNLPTWVESIIWTIFWGIALVGAAGGIYGAIQLIAWVLLTVAPIKFYLLGAGAVIILYLIVYRATERTRDRMGYYRRQV